MYNIRRERDVNMYGGVCGEYEVVCEVCEVWCVRSGVLGVVCEEWCTRSSVRGVVCEE